MEIGVKIRALRLKNNLTQEELADRCELTKGFISQLENDLANPSIDTLNDILIVLGTNMGDFFSELVVTHTTTLSKIAEARRMMFRWPSVIGSKLPGQMAVLIPASP